MERRHRAHQANVPSALHVDVFNTKSPIPCIRCTRKHVANAQRWRCILHGLEILSRGRPVVDFGRRAGKLVGSVVMPDQHKSTQSPKQLPKARKRCFSWLTPFPSLMQCRKLLQIESITFAYPVSSSHKE